MTDSTGKVVVTLFGHAAGTDSPFNWADMNSWSVPIEAYPAMQDAVKAELRKIVGMDKSKDGPKNILVHMTVAVAGDTVPFNHFSPECWVVSREGLGRIQDAYFAGIRSLR